MKKDYDRLQFRELEQTNLWIIINTIATILTGVAAVALSIIALTK